MREMHRVSVLNRGAGGAVPVPGQPGKPGPLGRPRDGPAGDRVLRTRAKVALRSAVGAFPVTFGNRWPSADAY